MKILILLALCAPIFGEDLRALVGEAMRVQIEARLVLEKSEAELKTITEAGRTQAIVVTADEQALAEAELAFDEALARYLASLNVPTGRPGEDLDWNVRARPPTSEIDWLVENNVFQSQRGLGTLETGFGGAYRASRETGDEDIVFGISGDNGRAMVGGLYSLTSAEDLAFPGDEFASACFVGLDPTASVELGFGSHFERVQPTGSVWAFDIGLRGPTDTFAIRANGGSEHVQLDGCWFLARRGHDYTETAYASGLHIDNWGTLVLRNLKWRGEQPGDAGIKLREHQFYLKSGRISTLIEDNDLFGGNRSGFQRRPDFDKQVQPTDRMMIRGNRCDGHGTNHEHADGGAVLTVWLSNPATYVYDNVITNFRYQALVISGQAAATNFPFLSSGNQHREVHIAGNRFIPGPATERSTASLSSVERLHLYPDNEFQGPVILDSIWNFTRNGTINAETSIHSSTAPTWQLRKYDPALGAERPFTIAEVEALLAN
tara:strand:+ start:8561 stop:10030 length:1470 start_codon:yes stop_codon:yes gene_type:complete